MRGLNLRAGWLGVLWLLACTASARTLHVGAGQAFPRLKPAIARAASGDTVLVHGGVYREGPLLVRKPLVLRGVGWPVLDGQSRYEILTVKADGFELSGFVLRRTGQGSLQDYAGVKVYDSRRVLIRGNRLENCFFGISLSNCTASRVVGNELRATQSQTTQNSSGNGIHLWKCRGLRVEGNTIRGHRDGIYLEFVTDSFIRRNLSEGNLRYGLHFMFSHQNTYTRNTFRHNGAGVAVMYSNRVTMYRNHFVANRGSSSYGLLLKEIGESDIRENTFSQNTTGIQLETVNRCTIRQNRISQNGWGMRLTASCEGNRIEANTFTGNTFDLTTNGSVVMNELSGNYWDHYRGYDLNHDGYGDVPYHPLSAFSYAVERIPAAIIFIRSPLVDILDRTERLVPSLTPAAMVDPRPRFRP